MKPYRISFDACLAAADSEDAGEAYWRLARAAEELGIFFQGARVEEMKPADVVPDSPLAKVLAETADE